jgi:protocatechuate 3,4-dioxygenase alpha subunit
MAHERAAASHQATVSQTAGPYFHIGLRRLFVDSLADPSASGRHITLEGRVLDGDGAPVTDSLVEVWQADPSGRYAHPEDPSGQATPSGFRGFGRVPTDHEGKFHFSTVKPGRVPAPDGGLQAPHILVSLFMRGLLRQAVTRIYFSDEPSNEEDPVLQRVPAPRRTTLVARPKPGQPDVFEWNVALQGQHETVFFDF